MFRYFSKKNNTNFNFTEEDFNKLFSVAKQNISQDVVSFERETGFSIDKQFLDDSALLTQISIKKSTLDYNHGRLIYSLLMQMLTTHQSNYNFRILEIGTAKGFSSVIMSKAIKDSEKEGFIVTIDIHGHEISNNWNSIKNSNNRLVTRKEILDSFKSYLDIIIFLEGRSPEILKTIFMDRINFAFIDGAHEFTEVSAEVEYVIRHQKVGDVILFDDYTPGLFPGVVNAVNKLKEDGKYDLRVIKSSEERGYAIAKKINE